ncbi:MAG TPA: peptidase C39 family protein [Verrucomicrobiota bacterium]|nr:peptidase C39 family protein [Verrucomicrobiota bacterium]
MKNATHISLSTCVALALFSVCPMISHSQTNIPQTRFIQIDPGSFQKTVSTNGSNEITMTSPEIHAGFSWDELIVSWNVRMPTNAGLRVEARANYADYKTRYYTMGLWSVAGSSHPRQSATGQKDNDGDVLTDTLVLKKPADRFQLRLTLNGDGRNDVKLTLVGVSLLGSTSLATPSSPNQKAWGKIIPVPERSQMAHPDGEKLCSPTAVSMLLGFWSNKLKRPELDRDVPEIAAAVFDPNWPGMGNWSFNMAYAGSMAGMRGYVARLNNVRELEDWIAEGVPVGISVCYNRLRGKSREPSGHIVVCCGFTENGDVIVNDPGTSKNGRKTFPRANLIDAWSYSKNTVYLVHPSNTKPPED